MPIEGQMLLKRVHERDARKSRKAKENQAKEKQARRDLWADWTEGGVRDLRGKTRRQVHSHFGSQIRSSQYDWRRREAIANSKQGRAGGSPSNKAGGRRSPRWNDGGDSDDP
jgi:hypothetical protein